MSPLLLGLAAYIVAQLAIGVWVSRRIATEEDYLVAGRSLGPVLVTFTVFATWFGAETCIGAAGAVYSDGIAGSTADPFGYALCIILTGLIFAVPLWRLRLTTLADLFRMRFGVSVERLAVILIIPTSLFWAAAQVRAFGQVLSVASGWEISTTITIAAVVVIAYTTLGGLLADVWTDLVQGIALIVGLAVLLVVVIRNDGFADLASLGEGTPTADGEASRSLLSVIESWAVPVVGSLVAAELVARMIAARTASIARRATVTAGGVYLLVGLVPVALGLAGARLVPGLDNPEQILPLLAERYLPTVLFVVFAGALVSAILSTVDSALLVAAGLLSHNVVVPMLREASERTKVRLARIGVVVLALLAWFMAFRAERVYDLVQEASSFGSAGIVTVVAFGLFTRLGGVTSATVSLVAGVGTWIAGAYVLDVPYPYLLSLGVAATSYVVAALAGSQPTRELVPVADLPNSTSV